MSEDGELYMYSYISRFAVLIHNDKVDKRDGRWREETEVDRLYSLHWRGKSLRLHYTGSSPGIWFII